MVSSILLYQPPLHSSAEPAPLCCHPAQILFMVGFKRQGPSLSIAAGAPLGPLQAAAARLRRLADKKGHSGTAEHVPPDGARGSARPASPFYGQPGFRHQEQVRRVPPREPCLLQAWKHRSITALPSTPRLCCHVCAVARRTHVCTANVPGFHAPPLFPAAPAAVPCHRSGTAAPATTPSTTAASGCGPAGTTRRMGSTGEQGGAARRPLLAAPAGA